MANHKRELHNVQSSSVGRVEAKIIAGRPYIIPADVEVRTSLVIRRTEQHDGTVTTEIKMGGEAIWAREDKKGNPRLPAAEPDGEPLVLNYTHNANLFNNISPAQQNVLDELLREIDMQFEASVVERVQRDVYQTWTHRNLIEPTLKDYEEDDIL